MRGAALGLLAAAGGVVGGAVGALVPGLIGSPVGPTLPAATVSGRDAAARDAGARAPGGVGDRLRAAELAATEAAGATSAIRAALVTLETHHAALRRRMARAEAARGAAADPLGEARGRFERFRGDDGPDGGREAGAAGIPAGARRADRARAAAEREEARRTREEAASAEEARQWEVARRDLGLTPAQEESLREQVRRHGERLRDAMGATELIVEDTGAARVTTRVPDAAAIVEARRAFEEGVRGVLDEGQARRWFDDGWGARLGGGRVAPPR